MLSQLSTAPITRYLQTGVTAPVWSLALAIIFAAWFDSAIAAVIAALLLIVPAQIQKPPSN